MLDNYTLNVSFFAEFIVVVSLFIGWRPNATRFNSYSLLGLKISVQDMGTLIDAPALSHFHLPTTLLQHAR
jgi:hypothetical protein